MMDLSFPTAGSSINVGNAPFYGLGKRLHIGVRTDIDIGQYCKCL